ncbi:MAG: hypothetical protein B6U69_01730 [Thermofilum sp. ex4484_15]|nr:MAG: hypothetical protein B6U69_01730 [Thermofilum sp. ex4484_15]
MWWYYPYYPPLFDAYHFYLAFYSWTYLWFYYVLMAYYMEMFRATLDLWRKYLESLVKGGS